VTGSPFEIDAVPVAGEPDERSYAMTGPVMAMIMTLMSRRCRILVKREDMGIKTLQIRYVSQDKGKNLFVHES